MNKMLNREKMIEAHLESQQLAARAAELCESAFLLRKFGDDSPEEKEECERAAVVCLKFARKVYDEAKASAAEAGITLPPRVSEELDRVLA